MIITIGREYGSGGKELGEKLAKKLGFKFYDKELVEMAAEKSEIHTSILHKADEQASRSLLYSIATGIDTRFFTPSYELPINDKLFIEQANVIKELAKNEDCVIVGRCADYILESAGIPSIDLFIYASKDAKIARISKLYDLSPDKAKDKIKKVEKSRKTYYNYYSNKEWGELSNYDLCINTTNMTIDKAVDVAVSFIQSQEA